MSREIFRKNANRCSALYTLLKNIGEAIDEVTPIPMPSHQIEVGSASKVSGATFDYIGTVEAKFREFKIHRDGLAVFHRRETKPGETAPSGRPEDRYKRWFAFEWSVTDFGKEVRDRAETAFAFNLILNEQYELDIPQTVAILDAYLEEDQIDIDFIKNIADYADEDDRFKPIRDKLLVEKIARVKRDGTYWKV